MNKKLLIPIIILSTITVVYIMYLTLNSIKYSYHIDMTNYKRYMWVFNDSIKKDIDTNIFVGCTRESDLFYHYIYKQDYYIGIWEFKNINNIDLNKINLNQNINLGNVDLGTCEILNKNSSPEITVSFSPFFKKSIDINVDNFSNMNKVIKAKNYKGFYGIINKMSFSNDKNKHIVIFDFKGNKESCLVLAYKKNTHFYIIIIDSEKQFDESIINILNLK